MSSQLLESQLVSPLHGFSEKPLSPGLDDGYDICTTYDDKCGEVNTNDHLRDDAVHGDDFSDEVTTISNDAEQQDSCSSVVNDTQSVDVEYDTQTTDAYDQSSVTQRVIQNTYQTSAERGSVINPFKNIERQKSAVAFRFSTAPKPNSARLIRPPPGKLSYSSERKGLQDLPPPLGGALVGIKKQGIL
jgi:hypothetical protein